MGTNPAHVHLQSEVYITSEPVTGGCWDPQTQTLNVNVRLLPPPPCTTFGYTIHPVPEDMTRWPDTPKDPLALLHRKAWR